MRNVHRQRGLKSVYRESLRPIAASFKMPEIGEEANTSTNASPRPSCLTPVRQAPADSMMKSVTASVSKLRRGDPPTIYIVPQRIRQVNEVAYEPQMVSIGPYHNGKERLQGMEENKWLFLHSFLSRNPNQLLQDYLKAMEELENKARSCYSHNIVGNEFVKMMVRDACFIVEIFLRFYPIGHTLELLRQQYWELEQNKGDLGLLSAIENFFFHSNGFEDPIIYTAGISYIIGYDMLLLENQIPFFVLQHIFKMACPVNVPHLLEKMALHFFNRFMRRNKEIEIKDSYYHLLHLFHSHLLPTPTNSKEEPNLSFTITEPRGTIPCATYLQSAGIKFRKQKKSNSILNLKFSHGVLEIPFFVIQDCSETLFRNLVAFEQCYPGANIYFTTYLVFMNYLVNTSEDVALLHSYGIIDNLQGSDDDVTHLFNRVGTGIFHTFEGSYLSDLHDNVQKLYEKKWNQWRASLKRDYFTDPWTIISVVNASIILMFTITQTFFTVYPFQPRS